jgi:ATP synthase protein I
MPPALPYSVTDRDEATEQSSKDEGFRRWTARDAAQLRQTQPAISPWRVVRWMLMASVAIGLLAFAAFDVATALSAAYGSLCVALPSAVLARGMTSPLSRMNAVSGATAFMLWEMVKMGVSIGMLALAPSLIAGLNWPALLIGLILTMKVYFVAAIAKPKPQGAGLKIEAQQKL